jgi:hypothetical protein
VMACDLARACVLAALIMMGMHGAGHAGFLPALGPLFVVINPVEIEKKDPSAERDKAGRLPVGDDPSTVIARTISELLPNYIQRGLEKGLDRRIIIVQSADRNAGNPVSAAIDSKVISMGALGVRVAASVVTPEFSSEKEKKLCFCHPPLTTASLMTSCRI